MNCVYKLFEKKNRTVNKYDELEERLRIIENILDDSLQPILDRLINKIHNEHLCIKVIEWFIWLSVN